MLDIFNGDAFSIQRLTDAINKMPFVPGRLGGMGLFENYGVDTLTVQVEEREGRVYLVPDKARGAPPTQNQKADRKVRPLNIRHLPLGDVLYADEVQGVRAFGSETQIETIEGKVNEKLAQMRQSMEATWEWHRLGAIRGKVLDADGTTVLLNLYTAFEQSEPSPISFDFGHYEAGEFRQRCAFVTRTIMDQLGASPILGIHTLCGDEFFDRVLKEDEVIQSYRGTEMAAVLRAGYVYPNGLKIYGAYEFGGIVWENYRGSIGGTPWVASEEAHFFPVGVPGLFRCAYGPANYIETVNTIGLPIYVKTTPAQKNTHVDIDVQSNPLHYCTRPLCLRKGTQTGS